MSHRCGNIFKTPSLPIRKSYRAEIFKEGLPAPTCHVLHVTCHMSHVLFLFCLIFFGQSGEASQWRVCYQFDLPHLVYIVRF